MFQRVKGFQDIFGEDIPYWQKAEEELRHVCSLFAVQEMRIPILERTEVFSRGIGGGTDIVEKEMFTFPDRGDGELLTLRPEGTAGLVRAYIENGLSNPPGIKKYYYLGPMFRRERPQKGRFRQFTQSGIEFIGSASALADADVISLFTAYLETVGVREYVDLHINSIGCEMCRPAYVDSLKEYLGKYVDKLCPDCATRYLKNPLRILDCKNPDCKAVAKNAPLMKDRLCVICADHFNEVQESLKVLSIPYVIDPYIVRGLDYYKRTAFEGVTDRLGAANAVGGGGRYDGLVKLLGGPDVPGVGFAFGMDRVVELMKLKAGLTGSQPDFYIVTFPETRQIGVQMLGNLRRSGKKVDIDYDGASMKSQMKKADRSGASYAIILGEEELTRGSVLLKKMSAEITDNKQIEVPMDDIYSL